MSIPFVGPSYNLSSRPAGIQRTINMIPVPIEPGNERSSWTFKDVPGLTEFADLGAPVRGMEIVAERAFVVAGSTLYELMSDGSFVSRGTLYTSEGFVGMAGNGPQLAISDASRIYTLTLTGNLWQSAVFPGRAKIGYLNQRILFVYRDSQQFGWTGLTDAQDIDALDFASAESSPDNLVGIEIDHLEAFLFGVSTCEPWQNTTSTAVFERNSGGISEVGAASEFSIKKIDNSIFWLASTKNGRGAVYRMNVYQPQRVSTDAIEEKFVGVDLSGASAFTLEYQKNSLYCLNIPGLDTTFVYDVFSGQWHEWADFSNGEYTQHRGTCHMYAHGYNLLGSDSGKVYRLDPDSHQNDGDTLVRDRIMPTSATPYRDRIHPSEFTLDCERGTGGQVAMRYSIDGGNNWTSWKTKSLGELGVFNRLVRWRRLASGRDLVVHVRCTDNVPFNPVSGVAK